MRKFANGLFLGVVFGAVLAPLCTLIAVLITDLGPGGYVWTTLPWESYLSRCGMATVWGIQTGGIIGLLLTLCDRALLPILPKRRSPASR